MQNNNQINKTQFALGTYRMDARIEAHRSAFVNALDAGVRLIDVAPNFMNGQAERLLAEILPVYLHERELDRSEICLISKVGFIQGHTLEYVQHKEDLDGFDVNKVNSHHWHSIDPQYIHDQITMSLANTEQDYFDAVLLQNPEYCLSDDIQENHGKLKKALQALEKEVELGRIKSYGIASDFLNVKNSEDFKQAYESNLHLDGLLNLAKNISKDNKFSYIQVALNLFESDNVVLLEKAKENGLRTLSQRPLNAIAKKTQKQSETIRMFRLAQSEQISDKDLSTLETQFQDALQDLLQCEKEFKTIPIIENVQPFFLGHVLMAEEKNIEDVYHWQDFYRYQVHPLIEQTLQGLTKIDELRTWTQMYIEKVSLLVEAYSVFLNAKANVKSSAIAQWLDDKTDGQINEYGLAQKVLSIYASLGCIDYVLLGMREDAYVDDVMQVKAKLNKQEAQDVLRDFKVLIEQGQQ